MDRLIAEGISDYHVYAISSDAAKMQSVKQLSAHPKWAIEGGFRDKLRDELDHVIGVKKALRHCCWCRTTSIGPTRVNTEIDVR